MDRAEIFATRRSDDINEVVNHVMTHSAAGGVAMYNDQPLAACGVIENWPGVWSPWMFATEGWSKVAPEVSKYAKGYLTVFAENKGLKRAQVFSLAGHSAAHRWLKWLGFKEEARLKSFGRNNETFILFARLRPCA